MAEQPAPEKITSGIFIGYGDNRVELPATFTAGIHRIKCPNCGSGSVTHDEPRAARESNVYSRYCWCGPCDHQWHEIFTVTAIADLPDAEGKPLTITERQNKE